MKDNAKKVADIMKLLANNNRLLILCALIKEPMNVGEIWSYVPDISQSALSQHLAILKAHNILDCNKSGQNITYFISDERVREVIKVFEKYYCDNEPI